MRKSGIWIMAACLLAVTASPVLASGFSIYEQSAKASAQAGAWVARADDAAANWYNPAALVHIDGKQVQFGMNLITVGSDTKFVVDDIFWGVPPAPSEYETEGEIATPIHFYYSQKINDKLAWGVGLNNPFGLVSAWDDMPVTLSHRRAELHTFLLNPNVAYAIDDRWSFAVGWTYILADIKEFSRDINQATLPLDPPLDSPPDPAIGRTDLSGDGHDWGWDAALHYKADSWSFGFTYRSELAPVIEGNVLFTDFDPRLRADGDYVIDLFPDGPGTATLNLPAQAAIGVAWNVNDAWTVEFDITWAEWSSFEELAIDFENDDASPLLQDIVLREDWDDTKAFRLGGAWRLGENHELRFGALTDEAPVPVDTLRPSIPDADRTSVTIGYGYSNAKWDFDFYYMPLWFDDITAVGDPEGKPDPLDPTHTPDGVIDGTYTSFTHLAGVTATFRF